MKFRNLAVAVTATASLTLGVAACSTQPDVDVVAACGYEDPATGNLVQIIDSQCENDDDYYWYYFPAGYVLPGYGQPLNRTHAVHFVKSGAGSKKLFKLPASKVKTTVKTNPAPAPAKTSGTTGGTVKQPTSKQTTKKVTSGTGTTKKK